MSPLAMEVEIARLVRQVVELEGLLDVVESAARPFFYRSRKRGKFLVTTRDLNRLDWARAAIAQYRFDKEQLAKAVEPKL